MKSLKREQMFYMNLKNQLKILKGYIQDDLVAYPITDAEAEKLEEAIKLLVAFNSNCVQNIESHLDDLANEEE